MSIIAGGAIVLIRESSGPQTRYVLSEGEIQNLNSPQVLEQKVQLAIGRTKLPLGIPAKFSMRGTVTKLLEGMSVSSFTIVGKLPIQAESRCYATALHDVGNDATSFYYLAYASWKTVPSLIYVYRLKPSLIPTKAQHYKGLVSPRQPTQTSIKPITKQSNNIVPQGQLLAIFLTKSNCSLETISIFNT